MTIAFFIKAKNRNPILCSQKYFACQFHYLSAAWSRELEIWRFPPLLRRKPGIRPCVTRAVADKPNLRATRNSHPSPTRKTK
jgi:hypothetical protein